jgi:hypothetical protein
MCVTNKLAHEITFGVSETFPMKISYDIGDASSVSFYLAPKIEYIYIMSGYNQAARIRNFCATQACPDKCNNGAQYINTVCSDIFAIGTNCCTVYNVYVDRYEAAVNDYGKRVPLYAGPTGIYANQLIGYSAAASTNIYSDAAKTTVVGTLLSSYRAFYTTPVAYTSGLEYTYTSMAKVTATFSIVFIANYPSSTNTNDFKASADAQLEYYQPVNQTPGPLALSLNCKTYATNGQLLRKKAFAVFKAESADVVNFPMQKITLTLSDDN